MVKASGQKTDERASTTASAQRQPITIFHDRESKLSKFSRQRLYAARL
jgi:hypothetical protein